MDKKERIESLRSRLLELPNLLQDNRTKRFESNENKELILDEMKKIEIRIREEVYEAKDPETGKVLYSNQEKRETAIVKSLDNSPAYAELKTRLNIINREIMNLDIAIDVVKAKLRATESLVQLEVL